MTAARALSDTVWDLDVAYCAAAAVLAEREAIGGHTRPTGGREQGPVGVEQVWAGRGLVATDDRPEFGAGSVDPAADAV